MINILISIFLIAPMCAFAVEAGPKQPQNTAAVKPAASPAAPVKPAAKAAKPAAQAQNNAPLTSQQILDNFAAWDQKLKTLKVDYDQTTSFEGVDISSSGGRLYKAGNNIRLDNLADGKVTQSARTDKDIINIVDEKGKNIMTLSWLEWQAQQPNKALFDFGNYAQIIKSHVVKEAIETKNGYSLVLSSAADGYILSFILGGDFFPTQITVSNEGVATKTVLKNAAKNIKLEESVFK